MFALLSCAAHAFSNLPSETPKGLCYFVSVGKVKGYFPESAVTNPSDPKTHFARCLASGGWGADSGGLSGGPLAEVSLLQVQNQMKMVVVLHSEGQMGREIDAPKVSQKRECFPKLMQVF